MPGVGMAFIVDDSKANEDRTRDERLDAVA